MKKEVLMITCIITCISVICSIYFGYRYFHRNSIQDEYRIVEELIADIKSERIKAKNKGKQLENFKKSSDKVSLLELWQKEKVENH